MGIPFGFGVRTLYDAHLNFWRPGQPCALRIQNYAVPDVGYGELGFKFSPSGAIADQQGFFDVPILPQPEVKESTMRDVGLNQKQLMFGNKTFIISHTFVLRRMRELNLLDPIQVFRAKNVLGIAYPVDFGRTADQFGAKPNAATRLFNIQSVVHEEIAGLTVAWTLTCPAPETLVSEGGS